MDIHFDMLRAALEYEKDKYTCEKTISCFNNTIFSLSRLQDTLDDGIKNPDNWYNENIRAARVFRDVMPLISLSSILRDLPEVENLQEDPFSHFLDI